MLIINSSKALKAGEIQIRNHAFDHFEATLKMLNESMEMCLPTSLSKKHEPLPVD